jgi:hypothetical protein
MASESRFNSQQGRVFSLFRNVQAGSGVHATSYVVMNTRVSISRVKSLRHETYNSPLSSAYVKNCGAMPPLPIDFHGVVLN